MHTLATRRTLEEKTQKQVQPPHWELGRGEERRGKERKGELRKGEEEERRGEEKEKEKERRKKDDRISLGANFHRC